ncbi:MAG: malto-oligosyltrehalose trehalohydrolase [Candidatus Dormibacteria bacterium]
MPEVRVWAPRASAVEVVAGERRTPMKRQPGGWYSAGADAADAEGRYLLSVDGGPAIPDPRSAYQPTGVHGTSVLIDHGRFEWHDQAWKGFHLADAVVYELHVGTFSPEGTFDGVVSRLPHLEDLGVNVIELLPVATFPGDRGWGYDGVDLYAPHPTYGGPDGLKRLVDACHGAGIAVVMDVVYNHLGPDGNYLGEYGPYFTEVYRTPWGAALNFDGADSDEVRRFFVDNALGWLRDYHCDGLRLDAVHAILDTSATHFLEQVAAAVRQLETVTGHPRWLIAESDSNDPRLVTPAVRGGFGFDAQWSDDFHHALHAALTGERDGYYRDFGPLADVATALRRAYVYAGRYSEYRARTHGREPRDLPGWSFLGYIQDHDQVGNRARGERIGQLLSPGLVMTAAALVLFSPFTPMLFAGEEWGASTPFQYFTDHQSSELARAVTEGRRREFATFGWPLTSVPDPQEAATFAASKLKWEEVQQPGHRELFSWYRDLLHLRRDTPGLRDGALEAVEVDVDEQARHIVVRRRDLVLACNLGPLEATIAAAGNEIVLASHAGSQLDPNGGLRIPAESAVVLRTRRP